MQPALFGAFGLTVIEAMACGLPVFATRYFDDEHVIDPARIEAVGFSKYRPVASNDTHEDRQRNRRVEIVLTPWKPLVRECPK